MIFNLRYLISIFIIFFFCMGSSSYAQDREIKNLISKYYPGKKQKNNESFIKYVKDTLNVDLEALTMITSDLDGNGLHDYAVILEGEIFVVFMQKSKGKFENHELMNAKWVGDYIIEIKANSEINEFDSEKTIILNYSAIEMHYFGKSSVIYYWDRNLHKFNEMWTSD